MDENPPILNTRPENATEKLLRRKFDEEFVNQAQRLDELAKLLLTIELAIPGLYATALKLIAGKDATLVLGPAICGTFLFWALALLFTLVALLPRTYNVDRDIDRYTPPDELTEPLSNVDRDITRPLPDEGAKPLSIEDYFKNTARYKYRYIVASCCCFFIGIGMALYSIL